jgi:hypothetical protein
MDMNTKASDTPKAPRPNPFKKMFWPMFGRILCGMALALGAAALGQWMEVGKRVVLDFQGKKAAGSVSLVEEGEYRLRYEHPEGAIHTRSYKGRFGFQFVSPTEGQPADLTIVYAPDNPAIFQPATLSYLPAGICALMFIVGMYLILQARTIATKARRTEIVKRSGK